jgi:homocysteine S-methyltransferase
VLDPHPERQRLAGEVRRLRKKAVAGAQFAVTQPVYDEAGARALRDATAHLSIPIILGVLPLRTARHAEFLHDRVAGIAVPPAVRARMTAATDPVAEGITLAREMLACARDGFAGAFLMPPFDRYDVVDPILS